MKRRGYRRVKPGTKTARIIEMVRRVEGATLEEIVDAGLATHRGGARSVLYEVDRECDITIEKFPGVLHERRQGPPRMIYRVTTGDVDAARQEITEARRGLARL